MKLLLPLLFFINNFYGNSNNKFIVIGHSYPILNDTNKILNFIDTLNKEDAENIFFLGDCDLWRKEVFKLYKTKLNKQVYFSPGNHDLKC